MPKVVPVLIAGMLLAVLVACGNDDSGDSSGQPASSDDDAGTGDTGSTETGDDSAAEQPASGSGSGTLTVDGITFAFDVVACGFDPDGRTEDVSFALTGRGETADGDMFTIDVLEAQLSEDMNSQNVSLWIGDDFPPAVTYQSLRIQMGDTTTGTGDTTVAESGLEWPLFEPDASSVAMEAGFTVVEGAAEDEEEHVGIGVLDVNCG